MPKTRDTNQPPQQAVRLRIVQAAENLFGQKGYNATSISDIVHDANVGRALIYYYFKDKRDLYETILQESGDRICDVAKQALGTEGSTFERLKAFMVLFNKINIEHPNVRKMMVRAEVEGTISMETHFKKHFDIVTGFLGQIIEQGMEKGELRYVKPAKAVHMMMGLSHSVTMMHMQGEAEDEIERDIDFAIEVLRNGISSR